MLGLGVLCGYCKCAAQVHYGMSVLEMLHFSMNIIKHIYKRIYQFFIRGNHSIDIARLHCYGTVVDKKNIIIKGRTKNWYKVFHSFHSLFKWTSIIETFLILIFIFNSIEIKMDTVSVLMVINWFYFVLLIK